MMANVLYFGAWSSDQVGHYLYQPGGDRSSRTERYLPFRATILDAGLLPQSGEATEGLFRRNVINGWTVLSFWDRSADNRPGSNSSFLIEGDVSAADGLDAARKAFPECFARFEFDLRQATNPKGGTHAD